jgi:hypothetical protein
MVFFSAVDEGTHYYLPWQLQVMITKIYHQLNFGSFIILVKVDSNYWFLSNLISGLKKTLISDPKENPTSNPRKPCFNCPKDLNQGCITKKK